jgi:hypothetical protein
MQPSERLQRSPHWVPDQNLESTDRQFIVVECSSLLHAGSSSRASANDGLALRGESARKIYVFFFGIFGFVG